MSYFFKSKTMKYFSIILLCFVIIFGIGLYKKQTSSENESTAETGSSADTKVEKVESGEIRQNDLNQVSASQNDEEDCQDEEKNNEEQVTDMQSANAVNTRENNPFFFNVNRVEYHGRFHPLSYNFVYQDTNIFINVIEEMEDGTLYTLEIEQLQVEDPYDEITMGMNNMGYFFVTEDTIYQRFVNQDGYTEQNTNEAITEVRERGEAFFDYWRIVCCENGTENVPDEDGWHEYVVVDGDKRIFRMYNDYISGTKEYKTIIWEKGKGMVYLLNGSGSERMQVELWCEDIVVKWDY